MKTGPMFHGVCSTIAGASCICVYEDAEYSTDEKVYVAPLRDRGNLPTIIADKRKATLLNVAFPRITERSRGATA